MPAAIRNRHIFLSDALAFVGLPLLAYAVRFEGWTWALADTGALLLYTTVTTPLKLSILAGFGLRDAQAIDAARALRSAIHGFTSLESDGGFGLPRDIDRSYRFLVDTVITGLQADQP